MKSSDRTLPIIVAVIVAIVAVLFLARKPSPSGDTQPSASAPRVVTQKFAGEGIKFEYPETHRVEVVTSNPVLHQIAVDAKNAPGVLTIRYNPADAGAPVDVNEVADEAKRGLGDGAEAIVTPTRIKIGGRDVEARNLKTTILGFPFTDVIAVVSLGGRSYVVLTHAADEDLDKANSAFNLVLSTLAAN
jgi:hypothetical protein